MSASKSVPNRTNKRRKPYKPAAITKLTPEAVKTILEWKASLFKAMSRLKGCSKPFGLDWRNSDKSA